jgi:ATP-dependent DNA helicase DinG
MSDALNRVTSALDNAEDRVGQREMATLVADAITNKQHLVVQAGTGTGKTLAYLVPAIMADARVVVATATKALQDQLATKDLPFLADHLGVDFDWAVLKGRSNYVCLQRLREMSSGDEGQLELETMALQTKVEIKRLAEWSGTSETGDMAELDWTRTMRGERSASGATNVPERIVVPLGNRASPNRLAVAPLPPT